MFNIAEYRKKPDRISDLLPWAILIDKGVILNKDGSFQKTFGFRGPDLESSTQSQLVSITARLNNTLKRLGSGWALYVEARRKPAMSYPTKNYFPDPVSWLIDVERKDLFERKGENYESEYFLTFQYLPQKESVSKLSGLFVKEKKSDDEHDAGYKKLMNYFQATVNQLYDIMQDYMYEIAELTDEETLSYLHNCISERAHKVNVPDNPSYLDGVLADTPLLGGP